MDKKVTVRLFYVPKCSGGGCGCMPDLNLAVFEAVAEKLAKKIGEKNVSVEAYPSIDANRFPFLRDALGNPVVTVNERIISSGKKPELSEIERELKRLKVI